MRGIVILGLAAMLVVATFTAYGYEVVEAYDEAVFVLGPASSPEPSDPDPRPETTVWYVGEDATAFVQDGFLYVRGTGSVTNAPWTSVAGSVESVKIADGITELPEGSLDGMSNLAQVNGLRLSVFNGVAAGVVKSGGFTAIAIDPSTGTGTVTFRVKTAPAVDTPEGDWTAVDATGATTDATAIRVPVPADSPAGFFKVVPD